MSFYIRQNHRMHNTNSEPNISHALLMTTMCPVGSSIVTDVPFWDVESRGGGATLRLRVIWELSTFR